jgi:hypothetical protein
MHYLLHHLPDDIVYDEMKVRYSYPLKTDTRKQSALTTTVMMQVYGCDHTMEKCSCNGSPSILIFKAGVWLYNEGNIFCQMVCLVSRGEFLKEPYSA